MPEVIFARQPIYNHYLQVIAYELLYRADGDSQSNLETMSDIDADQATSKLLLKVFCDIDFNELFGKRSVYINFTRNLLLSPMDLALPKYRIVIEILENIQIDDEIIASAKRLHDSGYRIALDDFEWREDNEKLLPYAYAVKLDVLAHSEQELRTLVERLRQHSVKLVAEKVETHEQFELCHDLGFDYFQGYFLSHPNIVGEHTPDTSSVVVLKLVQKLQKNDVMPLELKDIISQDAILVFKLLRLINTAEYYRARKIRSIDEAIILLGLDKIRCWAMLVSLTQVDNKPIQLMIDLMTRAKMCETLAERFKLSEPNSYFIAGLLSNIDALFDQSMATLLDSIQLTPEIKNAILFADGDIGKILHEVIAYTDADWANLPSHSDTDAKMYREVYVDSLAWAGFNSSILVK